MSEQYNHYNHYASDLMMVDIRAGDARGVRNCLGLGADPNYREKRDGPTALLAAVWLKNGEAELACRALLAAGADQGDQDDLGAYLNHAASIGGRKYTAEFLINLGYEYYPPRVALFAASAEYITGGRSWAEFRGEDLRLRAQYVNQRSGHRLRTPLHCAAATGNVRGVKKLLEFGADPWARDQRYEIPLVAALRNRNWAAACELARHCAELGYPVAQAVNAGVQYLSAAHAKKVRAAQDAGEKMARAKGVAPIADPDLDPVNLMKMEDDLDAADAGWDRNEDGEWVKVRPDLRFSRQQADPECEDDDVDTRT